MKITVSGKAYSAACDPSTSSVPVEEGWPRPVMKVAGRGLRAEYEVTPAQADLIATHLHDVGSNFVSYGSDPGTRAEGRACLRAAGHIDDLRAVALGHTIR